MKQSEDHKKQVVRYYDATKRDYRILWRSDRSLGIHFGYYDGQHQTHDEAILNINAKLSDLAGVTAQDRILDAGCGIGGSTLWLAANRGCQAVGVNIVPWQVEQANMLARQRRLEKLVSFHVADYAETKLKQGSFTLVWGLESIVHAEDKQAVIKEAFRLLKPGGRLIISEYILAKAAFNPREQAALDRWLKGWAMPSLMTEEQYRTMARKAGFTQVAVEDWTEQVRPSLMRLNRLIKLLRPIAPLLHRLRVVNKVQLGNLAASEAQMKLLAKGLWRYKVIVAKKP
ncbi:MAG: methyltransferase domain-containing protein [Patescibacteria group bacterium]